MTKYPLKKKKKNRSKLCFGLKLKTGENKANTIFKADDWEGSLGEEILVVEHVDLVHHESQERKLGVADGESERFPWPRGVEAVIRWSRWRG